MKPTLLKCLEAPSCVIWDFSEANYKHSVLHYEVLLPVVILPITLRSTLVMGSVPALGGRPYGYVFYGYRNERRKAVLGRLPPGLTAWERPQCVEAYQYAKFCISVHFYSSESGLEFHRLAQHIKAGCLPVYETPGDADIVQFFEYHKTLKFVEESEFSELLKRMDQCITEYHGIMQEQQIFIIQWWSKELESFEKVLKAFFYHYGE
uniref:Uncharacterized protein n=1 Tax=Arcella intermedia TaxID=1963864 RepID=A0A6B2LH79_9EUKA